LQVRTVNDWHACHAKLAGNHKPAASGDDLAIITNQEGRVKAEARDAHSDPQDLLFRIGEPGYLGTGTIHRRG
jgi:hypothetical protein